MEKDIIELEFSIDRGGTFTDVYCKILENGEEKR